MYNGQTQNSNDSASNQWNVLTRCGPVQPPPPCSLTATLWNFENAGCLKHPGILKSSARTFFTCLLISCSTKKHHIKQECIPVGCVPPALYHMGVSLTDRDRDPLLNRDPPLLDRDPSGQRPTPCTEHLPDRDAPWRETPCEQNHRRV